MRQNRQRIGLIGAATLMVLASGCTTTVPGFATAGDIGMELSGVPRIRSSSADGDPTGRLSGQIGIVPRNLWDRDGDGVSDLRVPSGSIRIDHVLAAGAHQLMAVIDLSLGGDQVDRQGRRPFLGITGSVSIGYRHRPEARGLLVRTELKPSYSSGPELV